MNILKIYNEIGHNGGVILIDTAFDPLQGKGISNALQSSSQNPLYCSSL